MENFLDTLYNQAVLTVGGIRMGPFGGNCGSDAMGCNCNQAMRQVKKITQKFSRENFFYNFYRFGRRQSVLPINSSMYQILHLFLTRAGWFTPNLFRRFISIVRRTWFLPTKVILWWICPVKNIEILSRNNFCVMDLLIVLISQMKGLNLWQNIAEIVRKFYKPEIRRITILGTMWPGFIVWVVLCSIFIVLCILTIIFIMYYREDEFLRASSPNFLIAILVGLILVISFVPMIAYPAGTDFFFVKIFEILFWQFFLLNFF